MVPAPKAYNLIRKGGRMVGVETQAQREKEAWPRLLS